MPPSLSSSLSKPLVASGDNNGSTTHWLAVRRRVNGCATGATLTLTRVAGSPDTDPIYEVTFAAQAGNLKLPLLSNAAPIPAAAFHHGAAAPYAAHIEIRDGACHRTWSITSEQPPDNFDPSGTNTASVGCV